MATFNQAFETTSNNFSNKTSIIYHDNYFNIHKLTYKSLSEQINLIYDKLNQFVSKNICVGIVIEPNPLLPAVILSIHKHECAFFCVDNNINSDKLLNYVERVGFNLIFISNSSDLIKTFLNKNAKLCFNILINEYKLELWQINEFENKIYKNVSYIVQTSGTTGSNKIVQVQNYCIMSNIKSLQNIFEINNSDVIFWGTPVTFDPFIVELMLALTSGATLFIVSPNIKYNKNNLIKVLFPENDLIYFGVTFIQMCPSVFLCFPKEIINKIICQKTSLRILALGGEKFPNQLFNYKNWSKNLKIFNLYGITEVSCWSSIEEVQHNLNVSLGQVLPDTIFQIRDNYGNILENGEGNLFIGSEKRICVIDNENITEKINFRNSGDVVKLESNKFYYIGRQNSIVKRLGHKINLNQIEQIVFTITDLTSICIWDETKAKLILFVLLREFDKIIQNKILDKLRIKLLHNLSPECFPDFIEIIPSIPLTKNGKTDKNYLLNLVIKSENTQNNTSINIFNYLWFKYFGSPENQTKNSSFINLGGNSILAIQFISEFDDLVKNKYSAELMTFLLDQNKSFTDCQNFIKIQSNDVVKNNPNKKIKLDKQLINQNSIKISIKWTYNLKACVDSSPVHFFHPRLFSLIAIGSHAQTFTVLNSNNGTLISQTILPEAVESSALILPCKEIAVVGCNDGYVYFIQIETGCVVNKFKTGASVKSTPVLSLEPLENGRILFGSYDKFLYCLNLKGEQIWRYETSESIKSNVITNESKQLLYVATIQGTYFCFYIKTGELKWKQKFKVPVFGSPCFVGDNLILWPDVKGHLNCFDCDNGDKLWTYKADGFIYSSLCQKNNQILFGCFDHNLYCLKCTRTEGKELFKVNLDAQLSTAPIVFTFTSKTNDSKSEMLLIINNKGQLYLFDFNTVNLLQKFEFPNEVYSGPIFFENHLFVGCRDNNLYCLELK